MTRIILYVKNGNYALVRFILVLSLILTTAQCVMRDLIVEKLYLFLDSDYIKAFFTHPRFKLGWIQSKDIVSAKRKKLESLGSSYLVAMFAQVNDDFLAFDIIFLNPVTS